MGQPRGSGRIALRPLPPLLPPLLPSGVQGSGLALPDHRPDRVGVGAVLIYGVTMVLTEEETRKAIREIVRAIRLVAPPATHTALGKTETIEVWRQDIRGRRRSVDTASIGAQTTLAETLWEWQHMLERLEDAICWVSGQRFPDMPTTATQGNAVGTAFACFRDGHLEYGWRREDGWQLAPPPIPLALTQSTTQFPA